MKRNKEKSVQSPLSIPQWVLTSSRESLCQRGKIKKSSTVAFSLCLPTLLSQEGNAFLETLSDAFLSFLEKESEKARDEVFFGGLDYLRDGAHLFLYCAFSPFSQRQFFPCAYLFLDENDTPLRIRPIKKGQVKIARFS